MSKRKHEETENEQISILSQARQNNTLARIRMELTYSRNECILLEGINKQLMSKNKKLEDMYTKLQNKITKIESRNQNMKNVDKQITYHTKELARLTIRKDKGILRRNEHDALCTHSNELYNCQQLKLQYMTTPQQQPRPPPPQPPQPPPPRPPPPQQPPPQPPRPPQQPPPVQPGQNRRVLHSCVKCDGCSDQTRAECASDNDLNPFIVTIAQVAEQRPKKTREDDTT